MLAYFILLMMGVANGVFISGMPQEREILYSLALALVLTQVCIVDRRIVGKPLLISSYWLVLILYSIAVPICIVRARGLRGMAYVAAHFVGMILVLTISLFFTMLLFGKI